MVKRQLMNLLLLGALSLLSAEMLVPYANFFAPPGAGSSSGGTIAKDAIGNDVTTEQWLKTHGPGDRTLVQGLKGDPTYLVVKSDKTLATYGINAVCSHLGCVVPFNKAENKFICPCQGSQYNNQGRVVRGPVPLSLALAHCDVDNGKSFCAGVAASGTLTSALRLVTKAAFENSKDGLRKGAILFFAISTFFELLCVILYAFVFPKLPIVKYYRSKAASEGSKTVTGDLAAGGIQTSPTGDNEDAKQERKGNKQLLWENIDYALDLFLIYVLTMSIFPGFLSEDTGSHSLGTWYAPVLIAMYNVFDLVGRYVPLVKILKL